LPEQLLESELFGHERGAFTGATDARAGKIEQASGGVLFLDEIGEMSTAMQAKFLRVLQEREFQRVGGSKTIRADVRIVAATNRDPRAAIASGAFREDLYYRLGVFEIHLPPLRERPDDIVVLAEAFLEEVGQTIGRPAAGLSEAARDQLLAHSWPGNVRELKNAIERAVILCHGGLVTQEHLPITVSRPVAERVAIATSKTSEFPVEGIALQHVERDLLIKAMAKAGNNKSQAAKLLGLSRGQLYSLLRRHGLTDARR
jgi:two-component system NtrC family response regulator